MIQDNFFATALQGIPDIFFREKLQKMNVIPENSGKTTLGLVSCFSADQIALERLKMPISVKSLELE